MLVHVLQYLLRRLRQLCRQRYRRIKMRTAIQGHLVRRPIAVQRAQSARRA